MTAVHRISTLAVCLFVPALAAQHLPEPGEGPNLSGVRITQQMIVNGGLSTTQIRTHGLRMFATPFNTFDGIGDGPMDPVDPTTPGGRPTLQGNGMLLRVNGLDAQTCMECHSVLSAAEVPFRFGIGGVGGANNNVLFKPRNIDVSDANQNGFAAFDGRFINPPFVLGAGGVELVAKEMTLRLQLLKAAARDRPGQWIPLAAKGVSFGELRFDGAAFDTSRIEGIDDDLVVRPFGRKGEFPTVRAFDADAMMFHFGMQPNEVVGDHVDADGDGVSNEIMVGELSALSIFIANLERPTTSRRNAAARRGEDLFQSVGCADCHVPHIDTESRLLPHAFPEVAEDPTANVYYLTNLTRRARFDRAPTGGVRVPMFSDLKRHDMGPGLAETFGSDLDAEFVTPRLWGIADTAPYLHDGRAPTLSEAILLHGGEAQTARDGFAALLATDRKALLAFLRTLRTPKRVAEDLDVRKL